MSRRPDSKSAPSGGSAREADEGGSRALRLLTAPFGPDRRSVLAGAAASALAAPALAAAKPKVVVIGGGFAGVAAARELQRLGVAVTLVEPNATYTACPFSNEVIVGLRPLSAQVFGYDAVRRQGVAIRRATVTGLDAQARRLTLSDGSRLDYDRAVLTPGVDINFTGLKGYDEAAAERLPHAWKAGPQTTLLRRQLEAMDDGGLVLISAPANPFRCPPGPYERASLIAWYLKARKPRSKLIILDAKDAFSKQRLFQGGWAALYPGMVEWVGLSAGGKVIEVDPGSKTLITDFGKHTGAVVNVIPPQRAGGIARTAGAADRTEWCPIDPQSFESRLLPNVHVVGDACIAGGMPKSAFSANAQAKACAVAVASLLNGRPAPPVKLINNCYSLMAPDYGISVAGVYAPANGLLTDIPGAGGTSPVDAPAAFRQAEAAYAQAWFKTLTAETFA
jgi:NADPH-dependent 2,4-dienoyl-CoA reductase/sulfur reductase-like enzyme